MDQNVKTIIETAKKVFAEYPAEKWKAHIKHIERLLLLIQKYFNVHYMINIFTSFKPICRLEEEYWKADGFYDHFFDENFRLTVSRY